MFHFEVECEVVSICSTHSAVAGKKFGRRDANYEFQQCVCCLACLLSYRMVLAYKFLFFSFCYYECVLFFVNFCSFAIFRCFIFWPIRRLAYRFDIEIKTRNRPRKKIQSRNQTVLPNITENNVYRSSNLDIDQYIIIYYV